MRTEGPAHGSRCGRRLLATAAAVLAVAACERTGVRAFAPAAALPSLGWELPADHAALSAVLARIAGDPAAFGGVRGTLDRYLAVLARTGPQTCPARFPAEADKLAYLADAHIAWAIALEERRDLARLDAAALRDVPFPLDGRTATLRGLARELERRAPFEPRLALVLNPGWKGGPPLPESALEGPSLEWQLARHAARCGTAGFWTLDAAARRLTVASAATSMWGLPEGPVARARRLLELVPPPPALGNAIVSTCGASLERCAIAVAPLDSARLLVPAG